MDVRSVFISDVHLGTQNCQATYLLSFLKTVQCERLYLVGDIIDLQALAKKHYWHPKHTAVIRQILRMARKGVEVIYIPGNHDAWMRRFSGQTHFNVRVMRRAEHLTADQRKFMVSHGDEFDVDHHGKDWLIRLGDTAHKWLSYINRNVNRMRRGIKLPYYPVAIKTKSFSKKAIEYILGYESRVAYEGNQQNLDGWICGHIHFGGIRQYENLIYCNDGDWVEHCTALMETHEGEMQLWHWSEKQKCIAREKTVAESGQAKFSQAA